MQQGDRQWWMGKSLEGRPEVDPRHLPWQAMENHDNMKAEILDRNVLQ